MKKYLLSSILILIIILSACTANANTTPEIDINAAYTEAASTVVAEITQTAMAMPTATATATEIPPTATNTVEPSPTITTTATKCNDAEFIKDVTIIDGATLNAGEVMTKTWLVKNTGSCVWGFGYDLVYGEYVDNLSGAVASVPLDVQPGDEVKIDLEFTVPATKKDYYSYWRLVDDQGEPFGEFLSLLFTVR